MCSDPFPSPAQTDLLRSLAQTYLWFARSDEQEAIEGQVRQALGRLNDASFEMEEWAREVLQRPEAQDERWDDEATAPMVVRAGPAVGIAMGQCWNARHELITAVQLHPGQRAVLVEAGVEWLTQEAVVTTMREEIVTALTRARFLGLDAPTVEQLCREALTMVATVDMEALWAATAAAPTLGDGEAINQLVRIVGVTLHEPFRVTLAFDDGVTRSLDLAPFLQGPAFAPIRRPPFFIQLRLVDGTLRWPNGATLDPTLLRYVPALSLTAC